MSEDCSKKNLKDAYLEDYREGLVLEYGPVLIEKEDIIQPQANIESTVYRVQIGAFNIKLSEKIFEGVDNVVSFKGNDGLVRYMTGSFNNYSDAINYRSQMRSRGFDDAFVVTFKDGKRVPLSKSISKKNTAKKTQSYN